jgi:hypothetical protein
MARLPDTTDTLSPEAQKAHDAGLPEKIVEQVRGRGDLSGLPARYAAAARVVQHVLTRESIPQPLADKVGKELGVAGVPFSFDTPLPEGQRAPF